MKTKFSLGLITLLLLVSCTNLDDVYRRLDDHDARIKKLETLTADANKTIASLQKLVDAQAQKISIVSYTALPNDEGYKLVMSDGSEIILKHGKDGKTPSVGIEEVDGVLYWTLDGELMRDAAGNPIRVKGEDGKAGVTPQLRVNADGNWEVSLDGGVKWELVKDVDGKPVKAVGTDAASDLKITDNGNGTITIVFNGMTFVIPSVQWEEPTPTDRPKLAIEYVAQFNLDETGKAFVTTNANDAGKLFTYQEAETAIGTGLTIGNKTYHLPSIAEWAGILPKFESRVEFANTSVVSYNDVVEEIEIAGTTASYKADYRCPGNNIGYALRFKDEKNDHRSAWRYEYADNLASSGEKILKITVRYLGVNPTIQTIDQIADENYWKQPDANEIVRYFPAAGYMRNGEVRSRGTYGRYMSASKNASGNVHSAIFNATNVLCGNAYYPTDGYSLRLFETKK